MSDRINLLRPYISEEKCWEEARNQEKKLVYKMGLAGEEDAAFCFICAKGDKAGKHRCGIKDQAFIIRGSRIEGRSRLA